MYQLLQVLGKCLIWDESYLLNLDSNEKKNSAYQSALKYASDKTNKH